MGVWQHEGPTEFLDDLIPEIQEWFLETIKPLGPVNEEATARKVLEEANELLEALDVARFSSNPNDHYNVDMEAVDVLVTICAFFAIAEIPWQAVRAKVEVLKQRTWYYDSALGVAKHVKPAPC